MAGAVRPVYQRRKFRYRIIFALIRQDDPLTEKGRVTLNDVQDKLCILVTSAEQRETEAAHWRDVMGMQSSFLFANNVDEARMNAAAGIGFYPCDEDMPTDGGTVLVPLYRGDAPMTRKVFAFWPESSDSSLQWEFAEALRQSIK